MTGAVVRATRRLLDHGITHVRGIMAHNERAMAHPVVDVLPAIDIPFVRAIGTSNKDRKRLHTAVIVGNSVWEEVLGALKERTGCWKRLTIGMFESHGAVLRMKETSDPHRMASCYVCPARVSRLVASRFLQQALHHRAAEHGRSQRHGDQRHKNALINHLILQSHRGQDHLHGTSSIHAKANGQRFPSWHAPEPGTETGTADFASTGDHEDDEHQGQIKMGSKICPEPNRDKVQGRKETDGKLIDDLADVLVYFSKSPPERDPDKKRPEDGVDPDGFGKGCSEQHNNRDQANKTTRPGKRHTSPLQQGAAAP